MRTHFSGNIPMKSPDFNPLNTGSRLALIFAVLIAVILGGNGLLIWQFYAARLQTDRLTGVNQQVIAGLRLQESLLSFHQRLDDLVQFKDAKRLVIEAEPLRKALLEQTQQARNILTHLPSECRTDPAFLPTLEAIEVGLPSQLRSIVALASSGDWEAVRLRLANEFKPMEIQTSALIDNIDQDVSEELSRTVANMEGVQRRIFVLVPATAICTFLIATYFGWAIARRLIDLRLEERVNERTRLTRELHDTFLQTIQGSKFVADDALEKPEDAVRMLRAMQQLSVWLGQATQEGRAALNSLRVSTIEKNDLAEAFRRAIEDCRAKSSMEANFRVVGSTQEMHPIVRDEIYRIGFEAIRNACAHSNGSRLDVELSYAHDLTVLVADNGTGMDRTIAEKGRAGHFGLQGMSERAFRIGGRLRLNTSADSGTRVELIVPRRFAFQIQSQGWFSKVKTHFRGAHVAKRWD
jgi:signal transduction histidine kinase